MLNERKCNIFIMHRIISFMTIEHNINHVKHNALPLMYANFIYLQSNT